MSFSIISAVDSNFAIGNKNSLLWDFKDMREDMNWFQQHTMSKIVVMGRNTYESLGIPYLPKRINVVLTRDKNYTPHEDVMVFHNINQVLHEFANEREVMIIGGSNIYKQFLPYCNRIYLTKVKHKFKADSYFPDVNWDDWTEYYKREGKNDGKYKCSFHVYKKPLK